ncbi:hypothetical protein C482_16913 [Natrialba chahannaoensis JCM 10990]|uniref:Uncharacterized protein n=1 Tax=Natrialba chahannaoensis JCM 10990 TaxID=1227492 RepID=M0ABU9_9EURY|nr:hypothetical protein [Natrialba chahannaoensis]ELY95342.1 hypothetical protein C482_16913 [Natrialba chahannaoensis JCM 10990]
MTQDAETDDATTETTTTATATANGIRATYDETETERRLEFVAGSEDDRTDETTLRAAGTAAIAQNIEGYAMLKVRPTADGDELERYYGFDMALDHAAELLGVSQHDLPIPEAAEDMGM